MQKWEVKLKPEPSSPSKTLLTSIGTWKGWWWVSSGDGLAAGATLKACQSVSCGGYGLTGFLGKGPHGFILCQVYTKVWWHRQSVRGSGNTVPALKLRVLMRAEIKAELGLQGLGPGGPIGDGEWPPPIHSSCQGSPLPWGPFSAPGFPVTDGLVSRGHCQSAPSKPSPSPTSKLLGQSSHCGMTGLAASWDHWDSGLIPGLVQWVKDLVMLHLWLRSWLCLRSDPWPGNSICCGAAKKKKIPWTCSL